MRRRIEKWGETRGYYTTMIYMFAIGAIIMYATIVAAEIDGRDHIVTDLVLVMSVYNMCREMLRRRRYDLESK